MEGESIWMREVLPLPKSEENIEDLKGRRKKKKKN